MPRRHETRLTPEGKVFLAFLWCACGLALILHENLLLLLGAIVLGFAASAWPLARWNLRRASVERLLPARGYAGRRTAVAWRVENRSAVDAVGILVQDPLDGTSRPRDVEAAFGAVGARGRAEVTTWVDFGRRGLRTLREPVVSSSFPLGIFSVSRREGTATLLVRAREGTATKEMIARLRGDIGAATTVEVRRAGVDRFHGLREFRDGDDPRRIHWRTTARRGVRTFAEWRAESGRRVIVVLGRTVGRGAEAARRFERAVSVTATLLSACAREGLPVRLLLGRPPREGSHGPAERGERGAEAGLDGLALVRGSEDRRPSAA